MQLAIRIQAGGKRKRWVDTMLYMLGNDPRIKVIINSTGLWESAKETLKSYSAQDSHLLLLQDDTLPCRDFIQTAERIIELLPDKLITLFSNRDEVLQAKAEDKSWATLNRILMAQSYIIPIAMIEDFISFAEKHIKPEIFFDDNRLALFILKHNIKVWVTAPSLVQHQGAFETTLMAYKQGHMFDAKSRLARWYIGYEQSGLDIDWEKGLHDPVKDVTTGDWAGICHFYQE